MPTATTAGLLSLSNLGAVTTTFSAPSSCTTAPGLISSGIALGNYLIQPVDGCNGRLDFPRDCLPHGDEISKQWESQDKTQAFTALNYYSPGLYCPNDWTTVGVYTVGQESNGTTATGAGDLGIFSPTAFNNGGPGKSISFPYADYPVNMFTSALGSSETAVICCPTGYSIEPNGICYSHIPISRLAGKTGCYNTATGTELMTPEYYTTTYEFWGVTTTAEERSFAGPREPDYYSTVTVAFDDEGVPHTDLHLMGGQNGDYSDFDLKAIAAVSALYLVHGGEEGDGSGGSGGENGGEDGDEDGDGDEDNNDEESNEDADDNAAGHLSPTIGVLAAWGFSFAAGLGLLIAW